MGLLNVQGSNIPTYFRVTFNLRIGLETCFSLTFLAPSWFIVLIEQLVVWLACVCVVAIVIMLVRLIMLFTVGHIGYKVHTNKHRPMFFDNG